MPNKWRYINIKVAVTADFCGIHWKSKANSLFFINDLQGVTSCSGVTALVTGANG